MCVCTYGVSHGELQAEVKQNAAKATAATEKAVRALRDEVRTAACDWTDYDSPRRPAMQLKGFSDVTAALTQGHDEATQVLSVRLDGLAARVGQSLSALRAQSTAQRRQMATGAFSCLALTTLMALLTAAVVWLPSRGTSRASPSCGRRSRVTGS